MEQEKYREAEEAMLNALRMLDKLNSYRPSYRSSRILSLADLYNRTNRFSKAEELLRNELRLLKSNENDEDWLIGLTESELGLQFI
jgi:tetratricopeptide (TPR) repeat protein